jgi:hypothetical protein
MGRYDRVCSLHGTRSHGQVFVWKVPEGFSIHTDAEEPADVAPSAKLSGHMRCGRRLAAPISL